MADRDSQLGKANQLRISNSSTLRKSDRLSSKDLDDLYRFQLRDRSTLDLSLSGLARGADVDIELYALKGSVPHKLRNSAFRKLRQSDINAVLQLKGVSKRKGNRAERISIDNLAAGNYIIRVKQRKGSSRYQLQLATSSIVEPRPRTDVIAPTVTAVIAPNLTTAVSGNYTFKVTYSDNLAIDVGTLDGNDILVTGANGFSQRARLIAIDPTGNGTPRTATYSITSPDGAWDNLDNGSYTIALQSNQVSDTNDRFARAGAIGSFQMNIATLLGNHILQFSGSPDGSTVYFGIDFSKRRDEDAAEDSGLFRGAVAGGRIRGSFSVGSEQVEGRSFRSGDLISYRNSDGSVEYRGVLLSEDGLYALYVGLYVRPNANADPDSLLSLEQAMTISNAVIMQGRGGAIGLDLKSVQFYSFFSVNSEYTLRPEEENFALPEDFGAVGGGPGGQTYTGYRSFDIIGNDRNNTLFGNSLSNNLQGLGGDDNLQGKSGSDNLDGGAGNDVLEGGDAGDNLDGGAGNDILRGGEGSDSLDGGTGDDVLEGGTGNDDYKVDSINDVVTESASDLGIDSVNSIVSWTLGAGLENLYLASDSTAVSGVGNDLDNTIYGNSQNNFLSGRGGNDYIYGGEGRDYIDGGSGVDTVEYYQEITANLGSGVVTLPTGNGTLLNVENLTASSSNDILIGSGVDNILDGGYGNDLLYGQDGNDTLIGDWGTDSFFGGFGIDTVSYDYYWRGIIASLTTGTVSFVSDTGTESLDSIENITGGSGDDSLTGSSLDNALVGGRGNDYLDGREGNDRLNGYGTSTSDTSQFDTLVGGGGGDYFILGGSWGVSYVESGDGYATIQDWDAARDWIETSGSASQYSLSFTNVLGSSAIDTEIYYNNGSSSDRIAIVQDNTNVSISRDFRFV